MPPQLRLVKTEESDVPPPVATFRADARLRLWGAACCAALAIGLTLAGYQHGLQPLMAAPVAVLFLLWSAYLLATFAGRRSTLYTLTAQRLEIEQGVLGRHTASLDLFRVRDVTLDQTLFERLRGVGRITIVSADQVEPSLLVGPVADARVLFDTLRDTVAAARKEARVVPLDSGR
jgi:uncharacterized membrane protein YdbT with pleckstrin-like domain